MSENAGSVILGSWGMPISLCWRPHTGSHCGIPAGPGDMMRCKVLLFWTVHVRTKVEGNATHRVVDSAQICLSNCSWTKA